jgi:geranylgeranyl diphosphate synthase type II
LTIDSFQQEDLVSCFLDKQKILGNQVEQKLDFYSRPKPGCPGVLNQAIRYSLLAGGKRLRPLLVLLATEACEGSAEDAMPAACAVEMVHTYSLIHDDLPSMDDEDKRRGQASCHIEFGEANAILAGDALLAQAFEILAREIDPAIASNCCAELAFAAGAQNMVGGQVDDLAAENKTGLSAEDLKKIHERKTGAMIKVSLVLGALIAKSEAEISQKMRLFGEKIGLAFQIVDDLLDFSGDATKMGKSLGKDEQSEKLTYVRLFGAKESRNKATKLISESIDIARTLGDAGKPLVGLAQFILNRTF